KECTGLVLKADIADKNIIKASKTINIASQDVFFELDVLFADLWDAEHPNLYTLKTVLFDENNNALQENSIKFGFREITYGGKNGTDKNKLYVNGKEIKLRGVCRHDVSRLYGRSVTKEDIYNEIKTYKEHNINHIRTSHYPASDYMLEVCDALGMYVEQENAACFKGSNGFDIYNPPADFLNSFKEMIEFSRNHPSVIIWSIANESGFEKSTGFRDCYDYIKKTDITRPVIFSYPWTVKSKPLPYDIFSKHYEKVTSNLGKKDMPILHDEFAHIPCYNIDDLAYDNSCRVFWGESIKRGWDNIFNTSGALGCDIWAAIDDVFYLPEKNMEKHQNHLKGECAGYGEWGCIFDAFKRLKPEAYLTKKAFSPIKINGTSIYGDEIRFTVQNRFDHTNLNEVLVTVKDKNSNVLYQEKIKERIAPHCVGVVSVLPINCTDNMRVEFVFDNVIVESVVLNKTYDALKIEPSAIKLDCAQNRITVSFDDEPVATIKTMHLYKGLNKFDVQRSELTKINDNTYCADFGFGRAFLLEINNNGSILNFKISPKNHLSSLYLIGELGVDIEPAADFKSVSWIKNSLYNDYPENHIARDFGTAYKIGSIHHYDDTDLKNITWEQDMSVFAYYEKASRYNRLAGNDFRTKRLRISSYLVNLIDDTNILINTDCDNINAYANPFNSKLQISKGYYKKSILWGNYWGERFSLNKNNRFDFSLSFEKGRK
ncbi:MAG: glycoside hydrolase family 2 protein, partial [Eubacterium sp.]